MRACLATEKSLNIEDAWAMLFLFFKFDDPFDTLS